MSRNYYFLAVEGAHDQAAIAKLLRLAGLKEFRGSSEDLKQDDVWRSLIPTLSPNSPLHVRLNLPSILTSETHSVAVCWGEGSNLIDNLKAITFISPLLPGESLLYRG